MAQVSCRSSQKLPQRSACLSSSHSEVFARQRACSSVQPAVPISSRKQLHVQNFKFLKELGLKKPSFLPDFGKDKRLAVLKRFYTGLDPATYGEVLADNFKFSTAAADHKAYGKADYTKLITEIVKPAIPDFSWNHMTSGDKADDGFSIIKIQATGTHDGKPLQMPGLAPIEPSGKKFRLSEETQKVKVEGGQIQEIVVIPVKGAGPRALYEALSGRT